MLAVVKTLRTNTPIFEVKGDIPQKIIDFLEKEYIVEISDDDEEYVEIAETDWYKEIKESTTPGDIMKIYRENAGLSQTQLGVKFGGISRQKISDYENGRRSIGKELAKKLSKFFDVPVDRLI